MASDEDHLGKLRIKLIEGTELSDLDGGGGSDPYCVFVLGDEEVKSKVVMGTSTPRWDDEFFMSVPDTRYYLRCLLYDRDEGSEMEDDFLGYAEVCLQDLKEDEPTNQVLKLQKAQSGKIEVELTIDMQKNDPADEVGYDEEGDAEEDDDFPMVSAAAPPAKLGSMAVKTWESQFKPPTSEGGKKKRDKKSAKPKMNLSLDYVHGFRGHDTRQCLFYNASGKVVWFAAAVGIVYDKETHTQQFFMGDGAHDDDILCMAMHPDKTLFATGQIGKEPKICVWDSEDCSVKAELTGKHQRGISAVAFSQSGNKLGSIGMDDQNSVLVWDWKKGKPLGAEAKGGANKLLMISFDAANDGAFFTVGAKHCKFWTVSPGGKLGGKNGTFGKKFKQQTLLVTAPHRGGFISGCYDGHIYTWVGGSCVNAIKAHDGPTYALCSCETGVVSGGKDGVVKLYDISLKEQGKWSVPNESIRSVFLGPDGKILAGTYEGCIYEIDTKQKDGAPVVLNRGHGGMKEKGNKYSGELWGLAMHPEGSMYATCGDDAMLRIFDVIQKKTVAHSEPGLLDCRARALSWHPDGQKLAVAQKDGKILIVSYDVSTHALKLESQFQYRKFPNLEKGGIDELKFSPDGSLLATGAHSEGKGNRGGMIDIIETNKWKKVRECEGHSSFVTHLDWSEDGKFLKSTDGNPELLYFEADPAQGNKGKNIPGGASSTCDTDWHTFSTICGWPVQGIFRKLPGQPKQMDMTDVNMVEINKGNSTIALGDDYGQVVLYNYPCTRPDDEGKYYDGHSSHVTNVRFTPDSSYLISTGGHDLSVFQWKTS